MYKIIFLFFLLLMCGRSYGVIHDLNEIEYEKLPSLFELENYELCLEHTEAVYCVASIELYRDSSNKIYNTMQGYSMQVFKHFNYSTIERGICVTTTCQKYIQKSKLNIKEDLENILEGCLNEIMNIKYGLSARIYRLNCDRAEEEQMDIDLLDYTIAILFAILLVFIVSGSYYDLRYNSEINAVMNSPENKNNNLLLCFSVFRNTKMLGRQPDVDKRFVELKGLYGVRTICSILVVFGHSIFTLSAFVSDPHNFEKAYDSKFRLIFSSPSIVQLFFFMSGFFMIYYFQITSEKINISWKDIPLILLRRWWKLTIPLAFVIAFIATWLRHLGSGPLWKFYVTNGVTAQCRDYYWAHFFYFNNFLQDDKFCVLQTWHLAVDTQLFIIGLIVHFMIRKRSWKIKCATLFLLFAIGVLSPVYHILQHDLEGVVVYNPESLRTMNDKNFHKYHVLVENNLPCFIMGMASAYLGYYLRQREMKLRNFKLGNILCWLNIVLMFGVFQTCALWLENPHTPASFSSLIFAASHRVVIGLIISVWTLGIILEFNGLFPALLEWRGFEILAKLSYGVFLFNIDVYNFLMASRTRLVPVSFLNLICTFIGVVFICYVLAFILYLLVEAPASQLLKMYMKSSPMKKKKV